MQWAGHLVQRLNCAMLRYVLDSHLFIPTEIVLIRPARENSEEQDVHVFVREVG